MTGVQTCALPICVGQGREGHAVPCKADAYIQSAAGERCAVHTGAAASRIQRDISEKTIAEGKRFVSRYYRNRRLGEFLKELDLSEGHSSGIPTIQEELEKNGSPRAEFFTDEDRRAMRIRIPIHPAFLENNDEDSSENSYEKATNKLSKKKKEQYHKILKLMADGNWHKIAEIAENLRLRDTRTKELLKELVGLERLIDNGKTKGKMYKIK